MRLAVSPIPIGRTPGFLLRAISLLAISGAVVSGSTRTDVFQLRQGTSIGQGMLT